MLLWIGFGIVCFAALCIGYHLGYDQAKHDQAKQDQRHRDDDELRYERQMTLDDYERVRKDWTDAQIKEVWDDPRKKIDDK